MTLLLAALFILGFGGCSSEAPGAAESHGNREEATEGPRTESDGGLGPTVSGRSTAQGSAAEPGAEVEVVDMKVTAAKPGEAVGGRGGGAEGASLSGVVVGPGGAPLPGATVYVLPAKASLPHQSFHSTRSGEDGRFVLGLPQRLVGQAVDLVAAFPGFQREGLSAVWIRPSGGGAEAAPEHRLTLRRGRQLSGRVVTEDGRPVEGAVVVATGGELPELAPTNGRVSGLPPLGIHTPWRERAVSRGDGTFELTGLRLEAYRLYLVSDRYQGSSEGVVLPGTTDAEITARSMDRLVIQPQVEGAALEFPIEAELWVSHADRIGTVSTTFETRWDNAPLGIALPPGDPLSYPRRFQVNLRDAAGRVGKGRGAWLAPAQLSTVDVALVADGKVEVQLVLERQGVDDDLPWPERLRVHYRAEGESDESNTVVTRRGGGYPLRIAPARYRVRVEPLVVTPFPVAFAGEIDLRNAPRRSTASFRFPSSGTVEFVGVDPESRPSSLRVTGPEGVSVLRPLRWGGDGTTVWPFAAPGKWRLEPMGTGGERAVHVVPGATAQVRW